MTTNFYPILIDQVEKEINRLRPLLDKSNNRAEKAMLLNRINSCEQKLERLKKKHAEKMLGLA